MNSKIVAIIVALVCVLSTNAQSLPGLNTDDYVLILEEVNITRINLANGIVEPLPIANLSSVRAIEYGIVNSCVFWYDSGHNIICRQCLDGIDQYAEVLASVDIRSVNSLAYDWMSELLYFIDDNRQVIDVIKTSARATAASNRWQRTVVSLGENSLPRGLAVHPAQGYLFWGEPLKIYRSDLNGDNVREIARDPRLVMLKSIAIDYGSDRIYWLDLYQDGVGSCDLNGANFNDLMRSSKLQNAWGLAVFRDYIFWSDSEQHSVLVAQKGE